MQSDLSYVSVDGYIADAQAGLVDEDRIVLTPTAIGGGTPFLPTLPS